MRRLLLGLGVLALTGCTTFVPEPDMLMAGGDDQALLDLRAGRRLYIDKCSGCHSLIPVDRYDDARWAAEVQEMLNLKKVRLVEDERRLLVRYLSVANGK
jgi:mono/diheme cytochrome c family protein